MPVEMFSWINDIWQIFIGWFDYLILGVEG